MTSDQRIPWKRLYAEGTAIVLSILLAFMIDAWWEDRRDARFERDYLAGLLEDLNANKSLLERSISNYENIARSMVVLQEESTRSEPELSVSELNEKFSLIQSMPTFFPITRTYANLTGSGDLRLIQSTSLKNALAEYYADADRILLVQQSHEMELVQTFQPYIIENLDYSAVHYSRSDSFPLPAAVDEDSILDVLSTRHFRNILTQKWMISTDLLNQYHGQLELNANMIAILDSLASN